MTEEKRHEAIVRLGAVSVGMRVVRHARMGTVVSEDEGCVVVRWENSKPLVQTRWPRGIFWQNVRLAHVGDR
jgi:hypothetical protein